MLSHMTLKLTNSPKYVAAEHGESKRLQANTNTSTTLEEGEIWIQCRMVGMASCSVTRPQTKVVKKKGGKEKKWGDCEDSKEESELVKKRQPYNFKKTNRTVGLVGEAVGTPFEAYQDVHMSSEEPSQLAAERLRQIGVRNLEHLHPAVLKVLASPLTRPWRKKCPTPLQSGGLDCQGSSNVRLHSLSSRVSVALAALTFQGFIHLRSSESCHFWESCNIFDSFSRIILVEEQVCK